MEWFETWGLTIIVFLPLVGALLLGLISKENEDALKRTGLVTALLAFSNIMSRPSPLIAIVSNFRLFTTLGRLRPCTACLA